MLRPLALLSAIAILGFGVPAAAQSLEVVAELQQPPGNLTVTPDGRLILSLHQFYNPPYPVAEVQNQELVPFPVASEASPVAQSVLGLRADERGIVWLLDNTSTTNTTPQLVGWDTRSEELHQTIDLASATPPDSFVNDLRIDLNTQTVYIADPAGGGNAALIVVDLQTGTARRVLEGDASVVPEDIDLFVEGNPILRRSSDGTYVRPKVGVDAIALDAKGEWLYYGPLSGTRLYRIRTSDLRDPSLSAVELGTRVEHYADRPICDGILLDSAGNIYLGELGANAIGVITPDRQYRRLIEDSRLSWVDDFEFSADGQTIYAVVNRLHLSAPLNAGVEAGAPPFTIFSFQPLAPQ